LEDGVPQKIAFFARSADVPLNLGLVVDFSGSQGSFVKPHHKDLELGPIEERTAGTAFYDSIYHSIAGLMAGTERGRKALIIFSDGEDNSSAHHMMEAVEAAQSHDVVLFAIRYTEVKDGRLNARNNYGIGVMERIARETGGADFDARKAGLAANFAQIGEQLRSSYELAYHSANPVRDGSFHKISIQVQQPGLTVRAKTGYYAR
jgi:Ca-activated chloride channel family protein